MKQLNFKANKLDYEIELNAPRIKEEELCFTLPYKHILSEVTGAQWKKWIFKCQYKKKKRKTPRDCVEVTADKFCHHN